MRRSMCFILGFFFVLGGTTGCGIFDSSSVEENELPVPSPEAIPNEVVTQKENIEVMAAEQAAEQKEMPSSPALCLPEAAKTMAHAYLASFQFTEGTTSLPIDASSPFSKYVQENQKMFAKEGAATRCAAALGRHITSLGQDTYKDPKKMSDNITSKWGGQAAEIAAQSASDVQSSGAEMFELGQELQWLANVLPDVAAGNYTTFNAADSQTRMRMKDAQPAPDAISKKSPQKPQKAGTPEMAKTMDSPMHQMGPMVENQLVILAGTLPKQ